MTKRQKPASNKKNDNEPRMPKKKPWPSHWVSHHQPKLKSEITPTLNLSAAKIQTRPEKSQPETITDLVRGSRTENLVEIAIADTDGSAVVVRDGNESEGEIEAMIVVAIAIAIVVIVETAMIGLVVGIKIGIGIFGIANLVVIGIDLGLEITTTPTEDDLVRAREKDVAKMRISLNTDERIAATPPPSDEFMLSDAETEFTNDITTMYNPI